MRSHNIKTILKLCDQLSQLYTKRRSNNRFLCSLICIIHTQYLCVPSFLSYFLYFFVSFSSFPYLFITSFSILLDFELLMKSEHVSCAVMFPQSKGKDAKFLFHCCYEQKVIFRSKKLEVPEQQVKVKLPEVLSFQPIHHFHNASLPVSVYSAMSNIVFHWPTQ